MLRFRYLNTIAFSLIIAAIGLASCQSIPVTSDATPTTRPTETKPIIPTPSSTPPPSPEAIDLGVLGKGAAQDMAWSPDGSLLAVVSTTGVYIYETQTWQIVETISNERLENGSISTLAFSPDDGNLVLTVSSYPTSFLRYDLQNGELTPWLEDIDMTPRTPLAFSPDGKTFALINYEHPEDGGYLIVLELRASASGKRLHQLFQDDYDQEKVIEAFAFSPDGQQIAAAGRDNLVRVWDTASGSLLYELQHDSDVVDISYSPDGKVLASTGKDATVRFWDVQTGENLYILRGFERALQHVSYLDDGKRLLVGQLYENIFQQYILGEKQLPVGSAEITIETGEEFYESYESITTSAVVRISPDTRQMAVLLNAQVQIWDLETGQPVLTLPEYNDTIRALAFSPSGDILALADHDVHLWDTSTQEPIATLHLNVPEIQDLAFHPHGKLLAVSVYGGNVEIWDTAKLQKVSESSDDVDWCNSSLIAFSPDGNKLATAGWCGVRIWETATGQLLQKYDIDEGTPRELAFSADGHDLLYVGERGFRRWNWETGETVYYVQLSGEYNYWSVALRSNLMVLGQGSDGPFYFFDPVTGQHLYDFAAGRGGKTVAISPDERLLARSDYSQILLVDSASGQKLCSLDFRSPRFISFSLDNRTLVSSSYENTAHLWNISTVAKLASSTIPVTATPDPALTPTPTISPEPIVRLPLQLQTPPTLDAEAITAENVGRLELLDELGLGRLHAAAWAPDGKSLAIGGYPGVYIIDLDTWQLSPLLPAKSNVLLLSFSPDGSLLAGQMSNSAIQIWEVATGQTSYILENPDCFNRDMTFSSDGQTLNTTCGSWSMTDGHLLSQGKASTNANGNLDLQWGMSAIKLLSPERGEVIQTFDVPGMAPIWVEYSPDGKTLLIWFYQFEVARSGAYYPGEDAESVIQLWNIIPAETPTLRATLSPGQWQRGHRDLVVMEGFHGVDFTSDSSLMATASGDGWVHIWDTTSGELRYTLPGDGQIYFSPAGNQLTSLADDTLRVWSLAPGEEPEIIGTVSDYPGFSSLTFIRGGQDLVTTSHGEFQFWSMAAGISQTPTVTITAVEDEQSRLAISPDGNWLAYSSVDELVLGKNNSQNPDWQTLFVFADVPDNQKSLAHAVVFSPDSSLLAATHPEHGPLLWHLEDPSLAPITLETETGISQLIFSPDNQLLLGSDMRSYDISTLYLWDTGTGELLRSWQMIGYQFAFHPDGITLAATNYLDGKLLLYDLRTGDLLQELAGSRYARDIAFSPDGSLLVAATDEQLEFWDVASGELVYEIEDGAFTMLDFSPDGKLLAVSLYDGRIQYWGLPSE